MNIVQFVTEVKVELSKIIWPKFNELVGSVIVVSVLVVAFSIYLGFVDFVFYRLAQHIFG